MRVLRLITRLNIGGPSIQAIALAERLTPLGFDTRLVHGRLGPAEGDMRYLLSQAADVEYLPVLRRDLAPAHDAAALARVVAILRNFQPQIVHTHMAKAGTIGRLAAALYNRTAGRGARAKVVHTYHGHVLEGYFGAAKTSLFINIERALARVTDRLVAISPEIRDELVSGHRIGRPDQYAVVPLGFDLAPLAAIDDEARRAARRAIGVPETARVVSTVGRLTAIKQQGLFLEAAREIAARDPAALFLIVGDGELRGALEERARTLGLAERTRFLGWRRDLATVYGATDVFLLTSRNEGTPVALIEAMASEVPGVSTDVGGVGDVIVSASVGTRVAAPRPEALADAVVAFLADPGHRRTVGTAARQHVVSRYTIDALIGRVAALYHELLPPHVAGSASPPSATNR